MPGGWAFRGIPYAAAPTGAAQFAAPGPAPVWSDVRDAAAPGPTCPQTPYPPAIAALIGTHIQPGADCLNVDVWTPDPGASGLPVLVWIHGGAFTRGANSIPVYDGSAFARDGVVLVAVNYRLGVWGFSPFPDAPDNRGLLDQLAALRWVQRNVAAFGGDPDLVTVFGESAGGMSIADLLGSPAAAGLFRRAIVQSGHSQLVAERADAVRVTGEIAARLGVAPTAAAFADVDPADILAAQDQIGLEVATDPDPARWGSSVIEQGFGVVHILPTVGDAVLPVRPSCADAPAVDLLIGTTAEEFRFFVVPHGLSAAISAELLPLLLQRYGVEPGVIEVFAADRPDDSPGDIFAAVLSELGFRAPALQDAQAHTAAGGATYVYEFDWPSGVDGLGACHALEVPFVFDTLDHAGTLTGPTPPQSLADDMHRAWIRFAATGDPGWPRYAADGAVQQFRATGPQVVLHPRAAELAAVTRDDKVSGPPR